MSSWPCAFRATSRLHSGPFTDSLVEEMRTRPKALPAELAPQMISVTNVQNVVAPHYITNLHNNIYQSTQNFHQNTINFISNTSNRIVNMGGSLANAQTTFQPHPSAGRRQREESAAASLPRDAQLRTTSVAVNISPAYMQTHRGDDSLVWASSPLRRGAAVAAAAG